VARSRKLRIQLPHHRETRAWAHGRAPGADFDISTAQRTPPVTTDRPAFTGKHPARAGLEDPADRAALPCRKNCVRSSKEQGSLIGHLL